MRLVTFRTGDRITHAGVVWENNVLPLKYPSLLELLRDPEGLENAQRELDQAGGLNRQPFVPDSVGLPAGLPALPTNIQAVIGSAPKAYTLNEVVLLPPVPEPPTLRDFYAFEQHVKTARVNRGLEMNPLWYEIPTFYFSNPSEIYGHDNPISYPVGSLALDFELEIACIIGREGKDIPVDEAGSYIAGYTIMNDWSARDLQARDMQLGLGPGKGKDFATSLGPCLVTPDEFVSRRSGSGASERYNLYMIARINGREVSRGNFQDIYYSFPQMIARASQNARLRVGDVIGSGTVGTGCLLELLSYSGTDSWLQRGDEVELEIEGIGVLRNRIL